MGLIASALISGIGAAIKNAQAQRQAQAVVNARNGVLRDTMALNRPLAEDSRAQFNDRLAAGPSADAEAAAGANRQAVMGRAAAPPPPTTALAGEGAPSVVNSEIARAMGEAANAGAAEASALGRVGAYGDMWVGQGEQNQNLASGLRTNANFAGGNLALLPHLQDLAEVGITRAPGALGDILMGVGSMMGSRAGANATGGWFNRTTPAAPLPTVGTGMLY